MKDLWRQGAAALCAVLCLSACDNSGSDYPAEYIGFKEIKETYTFSKAEEEKEVSLKIIAAEKKETDREVRLEGRSKPGEEPAFRLLDTKVVIPAKKKSATARLRLYPNRMKKHTEVRIICTPSDKEVKQTQLTLKLTVE